MGGKQFPPKTKGINMTIEKLTKQIFDECEKDGESVTLEEAREMAEMELKSKENCRRYEHSDKKTDENKPKKPKTIKISAEKAELFNLLWEGLSNYYPNCEILTNNKLISVQIGEKKFKVDIIETRQNKQKKG